MDSVAKGRRILQDIFPASYGIGIPAPSISRSVGLHNELAHADDERKSDPQLSLSWGA
jgi:hypothetical protein